MAAIFLKKFSALLMIPCSFIIACSFMAGVESIASAKNDTITIKGAWVRPSRVENSAAYMVIDNTGSTFDRLMSAQTAACERVELHRIEKIRGFFRMSPVEAIDIPAESSTVLKPGGMHLMLMKLKHPLKNGDKVTLELRFDKAGPMTIQAQVRSANVPKKDANASFVRQSQSQRQGRKEIR